MLDNPDAYDAVYGEWIDCPEEIVDEIVDMNVYRVNFAARCELNEDSCNEEQIATDGDITYENACGADKTECHPHNGEFTVWINSWGFVMVKDATYIRYIVDGCTYEYVCATGKKRKVYYHKIATPHGEDDSQVGLTRGDPSAHIDATTYLCNGQLVMRVTLICDRNGAYSELVITNNGYTEFDIDHYDDDHTSHDIDWKLRDKQLIGSSEIELHIIEFLV